MVSRSRRVVLQVLLERRPDRRARAVEEYPLICLAQREGVTNLLAAPPFDIAERDHGALRRRKLRDRILDHAARLAREQPLLGEAAGRRAPVARPRLVRASEAIGIDRAVVGLERRERQCPPLAHAACLRTVREDPEEPRLQRRAAL